LGKLKDIKLLIGVFGGILGIIFSALGGYFMIENKVRNVVKDEIEKAMHSAESPGYETINTKLDSLLKKDFNQ